VKAQGNKQNVEVEKKGGRKEGTNNEWEMMKRRNSKMLSRNGHADAKGERRYSSYSFLPRDYIGLSGHRHSPAALHTRERTPGTHCIGGWVGPGADLDTEAGEKKITSAADRTSVVQSVVRYCTDWATPAPEEWTITVIPRNSRIFIRCHVIKA
jgi:hypothetical protein